MYVHQRTDEYRRMWRRAAEAAGAEFSDLTDRIWEVRRGNARVRIANDLVQLDDPVTLAVAGDKALCYRLAADAGIPVPEFRVLRRRDLRGALRLFRSSRRPLVVKPRLNTSSGIGVTVGVSSRAGMLQAMLRAGIRSEEVIVEPLVAGETCRLLFLAGRLIHAVRRRGVRVRADGHSTIHELMEGGGLARLVADPVTRITLASQDLTLESTPRSGAVLVRMLPSAETTTRELRTVYDEDVTRTISAALVAEVQPAVTAIGSEFAGVDIVTTDLDRTLRESGGAMLEVNTTPGMHHHCAFAHETACDPAVEVLEHALRRHRP